MKNEHVYNSCLKKENKGFSLVEIIIVVAIASILVGVSSFGLSLINGKPADSCASKLASELQHAKINATSKADNTIVLSEDASGQIIITYSDGSTSVIGNDVTFTYDIDNSGTFNSLSGSPLTLEFDRGSGGLRTGVCTSNIEFHISRANVRRSVTIVRITGKVTTGTF